MIRYIYYLSLWVLAVLVTGYPAQAGQCAERATVMQRLAAVYGETRQLVATGPAGSIVEVFVAGQTGSWTITATRPGGPTCLVAAGHAFAWRQSWMATLRVTA